jgi:hypothetical protein
MNDVTKTLVSAAVLAVSLAASDLARADEATMALGEELTPPARVASARSSGPDVTLTIQPLALLLESVLFDAQVRLGRHVSLGVSGRYVSPWQKDVTGSSWGGSLGMQYHFGEAFRGFYLYPRVVLDRVRFEKGSEAFDGQVLTPSISLGHQWRTGPFFLRLGGGLGYALPQAGSQATERLVSGGFLAIFDVDSGVAF